MKKFEANYQKKYNKKETLQNIKKNGLLKRLPDHYKGKEKEVLTIIRKNPWALKVASQEIKETREVALEAVKSKGQILKYLPDKFKNDYEVVLEAVKQHRWA